MMSSWDRSVIIMTVVDWLSDIVVWSLEGEFSSMSKMDLGPPIVNSDEVKNEWHYTSIPSYEDVVHRCNFT